MGFDSFTIAAMVDEFLGGVVGGRVQDIIDTDALGLGLEIYGGRERRYLYLSADAMQPRAHLVDSKLRRGLTKPAQLGLLFRRYIEGGIVTGVTQPPWERLLELEAESHEGKFRIIAELMPRRANVLLVRDGIILDCLNRVGPEENRYRLSLPNHEYVPPPPIRGQMDPADMTAADMTRLLELVEDQSKQTRRVLPGRILGMSPLLAREIVFRASGDPTSKVMDTDSAALFNAFEEIVLPLLKRQWRPGIGRIAGVASEFSVYPLTHLDWQECDSLSAAVTACFGSTAGIEAYDEAKKPVQAAIDETKAKLAAKLASLRRGMRNDSELEQLRQTGELILAYQYAIEEGQKELRAQYELDGPELVILLNPEHNPLENAQAYFRRYEKAKAALEAVPALLKETQSEVDFIEQLDSDLMAASSWPEIDDVIQMLQARGHWLGKPLKRIGGGGRQGPLRIVSRDGYVIWVGRNSRQNEQVTFKSANPQDIWLHARDVPGSHVVIRNDGRRITEELIAEAAAVAAHYSRLRDESTVSVDYTRVKYVKAIKGAGPGMVTYRNERSLLVRPSDESILMRD